MKRPFVIALLAIAVLFLAPAPPAPAQQTKQIVKLATLVPEGSVWDRILREMGSRWAKDTQGRVVLQMYPGGVAGDEPDVVRKMRIGQIHAAAVTTAGLAEIDPAFRMFSVPMFFDSYDELHAVLTKLEPTFKQRLEAKGFILLHWGHGGWVYFFSKQPAATVEDVKKTKLFVWAGDDKMVQLWRQNGFHPVALAATDILTGLQTGMIDAYPTTPLLALTLQWYRTTPNMSGVGLAPLVGGLIITKQAWNKLSEADRTSMQAACKAAEKRLEVEIPKQDTTAIDEMKKRGLTVVPVPPAKMMEWRKAADDFAAQLRTGTVPPEILDAARRERDAYRQRAAGGVGK